MFSDESFFRLRCSDWKVREYRIRGEHEAYADASDIRFFTCCCRIISATVTISIDINDLQQLVNNSMQVKQQYIRVINITEIETYLKEDDLDDDGDGDGDG